MTTIRQINSEEWNDAFKLVWDVFLEFEAPLYSETATESFRQFIFDEETVKKLTGIGAFYGEELVGIIAYQKSHISLFFVKKEYQRRGIGRALFEYILPFCGENQLTVNASPVAVNIYHQMGFKDTDQEQIVNGIRFTPMVYRKVQ